MQLQAAAETAGAAMGGKSKRVQNSWWLTTDRRLVGRGKAAMSEEGSGILSGDAVESGSERLL
jgi:hypothetical protein